MNREMLIQVSILYNFLVRNVCKKFLSRQYIVVVFSLLLVLLAIWKPPRSIALLINPLIGRETEDVGHHSNN